MIPVLEPAETPIQKLLDTVGNGDSSEADDGFCKEETFFPPVFVFTASLILTQSFHIIVEECRTTNVRQKASSSITSFLCFLPLSFLDCEECLALFQDQSDPANITGPSFVLDFPTSTGVPQRALLTLPYGLMIGRSSIPSAGIGVLNHGPVVSPGMHFGPYEGEVTTRENAMTSDFSWEVIES